MKGTIYTAGPFSDEDVSDVEQRFSKMLGQRVELFHIHDESLVGGFVAQIDGIAYDASLKTMMLNMKTHIEDF